MEAGYSKKPLMEKLGLKPGFKVWIINAPNNYLRILPQEIVSAPEAKAELDFIHLFTKERDELAEYFPRLKEALNQKGMLWISWPKASSKIETDLNENLIRNIGLSHNLVDVKVCAVDEIWSGLKFVYRLKDRKV